MTTSPVSEVSEKSGAAVPSSSSKRASVRRAVGRRPREPRRRPRRGVIRQSVRASRAYPLDRGARRAQARRHDRGARRLGRRAAREAPRAAPRSRDGRGGRGPGRRRRVLRQARPVAHRASRGAGARRAAGGQVLAVDVGEVRADTAGRWLSSTMLGLVAEYAPPLDERAHRRREASRSRTRSAALPEHASRATASARMARLEPDKHAAAVTPGLRAPRRGRHDRRGTRPPGRTRHCPIVSRHASAPRVADPSRRAPLRQARERATRTRPIVDPSTWRRVQRIVPRGRRPKSDRLLARLGVLRCATCGGRMVIGTTRPARARTTCSTAAPRSVTARAE